MTASKRQPLLLTYLPLDYVLSSGFKDIFFKYVKMRFIKLTDDMVLFESEEICNLIVKHLKRMFGN